MKMATKKREEPDPEPGFALAEKNYTYLIIGFVIVIAGFLLMMGGKSPDPGVFDADELFSFRRITLAPIMVLAGFIFEIWAIMKKPGKSA